MCVQANASTDRTSPFSPSCKLLHLASQGEERAETAANSWFFPGIISVAVEEHDQQGAPVPFLLSPLALSGQSEGRCCGSSLRVKMPRLYSIHSSGFLRCVRMWLSPSQRRVGKILSSHREAENQLVSTRMLLPRALTTSHFLGEVWRNRVYAGCYEAGVELGQGS